MFRDAWISKDGLYRYSLDRQWEAGSGFVNFIMLNPSTADANTDDPTIRRCMGFAQDWGFGGLIVTNLFAFRATNPKDMKKAKDPIGPSWPDAVYKAAMDSEQIILAWGSHAQSEDRERLRKIIDPFWEKAYTLGYTRSGNPKHPLYLSKETKRIPISPTPDKEE